MGYFYSTWKASCISSGVGTFYAAVIATILHIYTNEELPYLECMIVVTAIGLMVSFPSLVVGSILVGFWTSKLIMEHPNQHKGTIFTSLGIIFGVVCCAIMYIVVGIIGGFPVDHPDNTQEWISCFLLLTVPIIYVTLASWLTWKGIERS